MCVHGSEALEILSACHNGHTIGAPRAIISGSGGTFCNEPVCKVMQIYGVTSRSLHAYHPQTSGAGGSINVAEKNPRRTIGSGYHQKDRKPSQNDKTEHEMEKTVQNQGQSPKTAKSDSYTEGSESNGGSAFELYYIYVLFANQETTALCTMEDGVQAISATFGRKVKVLVSEASIRRHLKLEDSEGLSSLPNAKIFEQLANMRTAKVMTEQEQERMNLEAALELQRKLDAREEVPAEAT
ncbi:reverse transcriptase domain-containing protein [Tanacetum coccineum]